MERRRGGERRRIGRGRRDEWKEEGEARGGDWRVGWGKEGREGGEGEGGERREREGRLARDG